MFKTLKNAWKTPELQKKMLFTLFIVLLYRLGASLVVPYVDGDISNGFNGQYGDTILGLMGILSGGALQHATLFALSVSPYITASIVMQLLTIAIPPLERMAKDGANGQKKINMITRFVTVALALVTSVGYSFILRDGYDYYDASGAKVHVDYLVDSVLEGSGVPLWFALVVINACFCAGAALVMWLAELINEKGIGNGISVILCVNIIASFPSFFTTLVSGITDGTWWIGAIVAAGVVIVAVAAIGFIIFVTNSERRIPIQYAKRVVGRKMYGGQSTNLPIKLNMTGVMPIIFASSIVSIPATIATFIKNPENGFVQFVENFFGPQTWEYLVVFLILTVAFSYFYVLISFNPVEVANNINSNGGAIPGHRPGRPTVQYINRILKRVTLIGAFFLCIVAGVPMLVTVITSALSNAGVSVPAGLGILTFSGSSLLIVVGVVLETIRDLEAQLSMRQSKGFLG